MQFTLLQHWENINHNHGIQVTIEDKLWYKWYDEMMSRYEKRAKELFRHDIEFTKTFDVDECQEIWVIWIEHLAECLKFLANK